MICEKCGKEMELGYGFAGGGLGPFFYCTTEGCDGFKKFQDFEMRDAPEQDEMSELLTDHIIALEDQVTRMKSHIEVLEAALQLADNRSSLTTEARIVWLEHELRETTGELVQANTRIETLEAESNQLQAKLHCVCGSSVDHSDYEGHSPKSMYDYALDGANKRIEALEKELRARDEAVSILSARIETLEARIKILEEALWTIEDPTAQLTQRQIDEIARAALASEFK